MLVNREEIARRIAYKEGYNIGDIIDVLIAYEDVIEEAVQNGEEVKQGKLYKITPQNVPEKLAYNGIDKTYYTREAKIVPKIRPLSRIKNVELPAEEEEE